MKLSPVSCHLLFRMLFATETLRDPISDLDRPYLAPTPEAAAECVALRNWFMTQVYEQKQAGQMSGFGLRNAAGWQGTLEPRYVTRLKDIAAYYAAPCRLITNCEAYTFLTGELDGKEVVLPQIGGEVVTQPQ
jgi:hypothetical protein